jgi:hypothetical protein
MGLEATSAGGADHIRAAATGGQAFEIGSARMKKKCAVIIGVDRTGVLPHLSGAASGARDFEAWAAKQGFDVTTLTDENGKKVTAVDVRKAIKDFTNKLTYEQMIVFFAGHGILKGSDYELWLLSDAPDDANEAVNVSGSIALARRCRIPYIAFISDACRALVNDSLLSQVTGSVVFPTGAPAAEGPEIDVFYATRPGDASLEFKDPSDACKYSGIFTEQLLRGLSGLVSEVIVNRASPEKSVITSRKLKPFLAREIPNAVSRISLRLQQFPEIRVESDLPRFLAEVDGAAIIGSDPPFLGLQKPPLSESEDRRRQEEAKAQNIAVDQLLKSKGRESFETRTGFTVVGAKINGAFARDLDLDIFEENAAWHVRVQDFDRQRLGGRSVCIHFDDGRCAVVAVMDGLIGTITVEDGRVVQVSYIPSRNTEIYNAYTQVADEIDRRRATIAVASRNGAFLTDLSEARDLASYLRKFKHFDPTLGIYAAYAYAQSGNWKGIASVMKYMESEPLPVPFDVALLASAVAGAEKPRHIAPFGPMLTQGWALLDPFIHELPNPLVELRSHLIPSLWTTFNSHGADTVWSALKSGVLT